MLVGNKCDEESGKREVSAKTGEALQVIIQQSIRLSVAKDLTDRWTDMVLLYSEVSCWAWKCKLLFQLSVSTHFLTPRRNRQ